MPRRSVKLRFYENLEANSIEFNGVPRRSFEMIDTIVRLRVNGFGAAHFGYAEMWWRRRESNKRPEIKNSQDHNRLGFPGNTAYSVFIVTAAAAFSST
jgi:hypothetical protein